MQSSLPLSEGCSLTSPQREIWFDQLFHGEAPLYNIGGYMRVARPVDLAIFRDAAALLVRKFDVLRIVLQVRDDAEEDALPDQVFVDTLSFDVPFHDFSGAGDPHAAAMAWMRPRFSEPFALHGEPLFRYALLKVGAESFYIFGCYHHLIADGWTIALLSRALGDIYTALEKGRDPDLFAPSYQAFIDNDRAYIDSRAFATQREYWLKKFQSLPEPLFAARYRNHASVQQEPSRCSTMTLPRGWYDRLAACAREQGANTFHAILGTLYVYFTRTARRDEMVVGLPVLNRGNAAFKETAGLFVGMTAARFSFGTDLSFGELLQAIGRELKQNYRHQRFPISELNRGLGRQHAAQGQLFDIGISYERHDHAAFFGNAHGIAVPLVNEHQTAPLMLYVREFHDDEDVQVDFVYNKAFFNADEIAALQQRLRGLLDAVQRTPDAPLHALPVLSAAEYRMLTTGWNATAVAYPQARPVHQLIEMQAEATPDAPALVYEEVRLSYRELNAAANRLAHRLLFEGARPDMLIGICAERSVELAVGLLAILKAGAAYVPLDPDYPAERLATMLDDTGAPLLLTQRAIWPRLGLQQDDLQAQVLALDMDMDRKFPSRNPCIEVDPRQLAYTIYTSGSTGKPKGAGVPHCGLTNRLLWMQETYKLTAADRVLQKTPFSFDVSIWEFFWPLMTGAVLVMAKPGDHKDPARLAGLIRQQDITTLHFVPAMLQAFVEHGALPGCASLRRVFASGEALPAELQQRFYRQSQAVLYNLYGPTEASIDVTAWTCIDEAAHTVPIGRPIANTQIYLLDADREPVPAGVEGELYIGGVQLARGYHRRPDLTAERFVPDPFGPPGSRLYRTGDVARWRMDGAIEYLGRTDHQVKIRGLRIELGEIEAVLLAHPGVREAVVAARNEEGGDGKRLVAYLVVHAGISEEALRAHLQASLPDYMTPSAFVLLDALPLSPNGKVDRKALPEPVFVRGEYAAPGTATEIMVAQLWCDLLGCERAGLHDNFFALGGHSLLAARFVSRLRARNGVELPLRAIFETPVLQALARRIALAQVQEGTDDASPVARADITPVPPDRNVALPLSFPQQRLWFLDRMETGSAFYNMAGGLRLAGVLDAKALEAALKDVVQRHEVLRTSYVIDATGDEVTQIIANEVPLSLRVSDLSGLAAPERAIEARRLAEAEAAHPFDLRTAPPVRAHLLRLDANEHWLLLTLHHIAADGWSMAILQREISAFYNLHAAGIPAALPPLPLQYADFAAWQRRLPQGPQWEHQLGYWRTQLAGAPALLELPADHVRPARQSYRGGRVRFTVPAALAERLNKLGREHGATLFMTLLGAFGVLLSRYSAQDDICIGTPVANRRHAEFEGLIGCFVNTLVLRLKRQDDPSFVQWLCSVRETALEAYTHQDIPFEQLVEALQPERTLSHSPLFQVMFALHNMGTGAATHAAALDGLETQALDIDLPVAKFDLTLDMWEEADALHACFEYSTDLFEPATIERMAGHFQVLLEAVAQRPETPFSQLPLLDDDERRRVLVEWNDSAAVYPHGQTVQQLFEAQVRRSPHAVALAYEDSTLSYAELNAEANRLAHYLCDVGVGPDDLVGICLDRSIDMIVALLAVLKAGGGYVPLDPAYPCERLAMMLDDARPALLLTRHALLEGLQAGVTPVFCFDAQRTALAVQSSTDPRPELEPDHLAYVLYTSGSTGRPKGVMVRHGGLANLAWHQAEKLRSHGCRSVLQFASINFDMSVEEIFPALITGARLVIRPSAMAAPDAAFLQLIESHRIDALNLPTVFWHEWVNRLQAGESAFPACVKMVAVGGEKVHAEQYRRWTQWTRMRGGTWCNAYGPTESTVNAAAFDVPFSETCNSREIPLGRPIANTRIHILDAYLNPVPAGVAGELHIAGDGLARGYLGRPDLTAEKFIPDPFSSTPGARMYKSGDLARYLSDGSIEYLGRIDGQVKIRGFRIELGEIEAALAAHPDVDEAVATVHEDPAGGKRLLAYYMKAATAKDAVDAGALRTHLAQSLPDYMLPAAYVQLAALPLTPNGKLDRRALPAPDEHALAARVYEAPQGETEQTMARIWAGLLKLERIGRQDNFFELGGHSLLAVSLLERMRRHGLHADVRDLFTAPTLAGLAATIGRRHAGAEIPPNRIPPGCDAIHPDMLPLVALAPADIDRITAMVPGGAANVQDIYPLGPLQQGILFHHLMTAEGDAYLERVLFATDTRERLDGFLSALRAVLKRHDILRTAVLWEGLPEPVQVVWRDAVLPVEQFTPDSRMGDAANGIAAQLCERFDPRHYRLDVREAPLVRAVIANDPENDRWLLLLLSHHLAFDHTALDILLEEVRAHMLMQAERLPAPLPFRNFIAQAKRGVSAAEHEAFFRRMLGDVDEPTVPFGLQDICGDGSRIIESRREVDPGLARRLRALARKLGVSAATLFHVAWAQVLARTSGRSDVVFGTVLFGRMQGGEGAERVMGLFINTLPLRLRMGEVSIARNVRRAHALLAELLRHEHASLAQAQRCSAIPAPAPLFSALLNYRYSAQDALSSPLRSWDGIELLSAEERSNYPFALSVDDLGEGFALTTQTDAAVDPARIGGFMHTALASLADALETAPDTPSHAIEVLPVEERELLQTWNRTAASLPSGHTIHALFETCAARHPGQIAAVFEDRSLTYAVLNARANRLAHYLRGQGVGTDELVGICVERSLEMIVAVLGVLKAGAAYLPLDPALPQARMAYMLDDAGPHLLLTQQHLLARLPETGVRPFCLDRDAAHLVAWPEHDPPQQAWPEHLAYVIYTSGSTGNPKGTLIHHRALVNLALAQQAALALRPGMRVLQWASFNFDASVWDIFPTLTASAQLCLASHEAVLPGMNLLETLRRHRIELITLTPSSLSALPLEHLPDLKTLVVAGERCDHALIVPWLKRYTVINAYGPTEATVCATVYPCTDDGRRHPPIGRPIANTQIHILDAYLQPVPVGVIGELYIAGEGLARGYLGRPDLTAERFTQNPFSDQAGARMYKTGDLARYLPDGHIEYIGRIDDQVKIRGYRIELGEIEFALNELPSVRQAAVLAQQAPAGGLRLLAYVVPEDIAVSAESGSAILRAALARSLPDYMVPARFVFLPRIPVNTSGKVDRKALDALTLDEDEADAEKEEPRTWTEQRLAAIWTALLGRASIGRHDNFFHAGGHSLLAVQLAAKVKETFGVVLPLSQIFASPTLAAFAQAVDMHETNDANDTQPLRAGLVVPMQGRGVNREQGVPTFLIHPSGGTVFCYDQLARQLGDGGPVYAIQSPEIAGLELDYDFDSLCRRYACEIGALCPEGMVRIAGWSLGGALALRIAEMLEQEQRVVESVSLFDTHVAIQERARTWEEFLAWAFLFLEPAALALDRDFAATHGNVRAIAEACGMESFLALLRDDPQWLLVQGIDARYLDFLREQYRIQQVHVALLREFSPGMVNAPLHVAWAQDSIAGGVMPADWLSLTRAPARSTQCILPGHHDNLLLNEANLAVIARNMLGRTGVEACTATTFNAPSR